MMRRRFMTLMMILGTAAGCAGYNQASAAGDVIDPADAAKTVVLHVENRGVQSVELRAVQGVQSTFVGSVSPGDTANILLDPTLFPTGSLYLLGIPADNRGRAVVGPLAATKGNRINLTLETQLSASHAIVVH